MYSMTGYGKGEIAYGNKRLIVELKSVNHRFLSLSFKSPRGFAAVEDNLRTYLKSRFVRGHIEVYINLVTDACQAEVSINTELCDKYMAVASELAAKYGIANDFTINALMMRSDIYNAVNDVDDGEQIVKCAISATEQAADMLSESRSSEGQKIAADLTDKIESIEQTTCSIKSIASMQVDQYRDKLLQRVKDALGSIAVDEQRLMNEVVFYADKVATDEEFTRLLAHTARFNEVMSGRVEIGKTLDAIAQEMLREANTIGSKCSDSSLSSLVIKLKGDIEKIREQVQNIE